MKTYVATFLLIFKATPSSLYGQVLNSRGCLMLNRLNFDDVGCSCHHLDGVASHIVIFQPFIDVESCIALWPWLVWYHIFVWPGKNQSVTKYKQEFESSTNTDLSPMSSQNVFWCILPDPEIFNGFKISLLSRFVDRSSMRVVGLNVEVIVSPFITWHKPASVMAMWKSVEWPPKSKCLCNGSCKMKMFHKSWSDSASHSWKPSDFLGRDIFWPQQLRY